MKRENISEMLLSFCFPINIRPAGPPKMKSRYGIHYWKVGIGWGGGVGGQRFFYSLKQIYLVFNHLTPYAGNTNFSPPAANTPLGINCLFYAQQEPICFSPRGVKDHKCTVYRLSALDKTGVCDLQKITNAQFTAFPG